MSVLTVAKPNKIPSGACHGMVDRGGAEKDALVATVKRLLTWIRIGCP